MRANYVARANCSLIWNIANRIIPTHRIFLPIIHQTIHFSTSFKVATFLGPIPLKQPSFLQTVLYRHLSYIYNAKLSFPTKRTRWNGFNRHFNESIADQLKLFRSLISNASSVDWHSNLITFRPHCLNQFFFHPSFLIKHVGSVTIRDGEYR